MIPPTSATSGQAAQRDPTIIRESEAFGADLESRARVTRAPPSSRPQPVPSHFKVATSPFVGRFRRFAGDGLEDDRGGANFAFPGT